MSRDSFYIFSHSSLPWARRHNDIALKLFLGTGVLAGAVALIVRKLRAVREKMKAIENKATDPRYIDFVEQQMRKGVYDEAAIVEVLKSKIIPVMQRGLNSSYLSGEINRNEEKKARDAILELKTANTLEDLYDLIKDPDVAREISAYRTAMNRIQIGIVSTRANQDI